MKNNDFQELVDQNLSGLVWDERKRQSVLFAVSEEEKPVKKISTTFILIAAIVCLSVTALAAGLVLSRNVDDMSVARRELEKAYGVTSTMLGSDFGETVEHKDNETIITFWGNEGLRYVLGEYTVTVQNGKVALWLSEDHRNKEEVELNDSPVEVLIFKEAIALGWDCPRASILFLQREWNNERYEFNIQTLGRIMRMPEQTHYDDKPELNYGYVYTASDNFTIVEDLAKDYVSQQRLTIDHDIYNSRPQLFSEHIRRKRELTRLSGDFKTVFNQAAKEYDLKNKINSDVTQISKIIKLGATVTELDKGGEQEVQFKDKKHDVSIEHDGLKLYGEFYDFGKKKTALFLCGRCECLMYAYYYAKPYIESGLNVLFIDQRAHGYSEGQLSTVGIKESEDVVAWMKFIKDEYKQESFILHCVCVGGSSGLLATVSPNNPGLVEKIVVDGVFINFKESYRRHYLDLGHKIFPVFHLIWFWFRVYTGVSVNKASPFECVKKLDCPILFIHTKKDKYSLPENAQKVFDNTKTDKKYLVWFDVGSHSHIRNHATERYDETIKDFLTNK